MLSMHAARGAWRFWPSRYLSGLFVSAPDIRVSPNLNRQVFLLRSVGSLAMLLAMRLGTLEVSASARVSRA